MPTTRTAVTTPNGTVHTGEFVHYCGSLIGFLGDIVELVGVSSHGRLTLKTCTGGVLTDVRPKSVRPCNADCDHH